MKGDVIDKDHTVSRYCGYTKLSEEGNPTKAAWEFSESDLNDDDPHLSVNWLEYFSGKTKNGQIDEIREAFKRKGYKLGGTAKFALAKVLEIHNILSEVGIDASVLHWPDEKDPSHSGIFAREADVDIMALKLAQMNCEMVPAKKVVVSLIQS